MKGIRPDTFLFYQYLFQMYVFRYIYILQAVHMARIGEDQMILTIRFLPQSLRNEVSGLPTGSIGEVWEPPSCHHRRHPSA